jgi:hypothetical protein
VITLRLPLAMTPVVRFKDDARPQSKMHKATLFIHRKGDTQGAQDDVIHMSESDMMHDTVEIVYKSPDLRKAKRVILTTSKALAYLGDVLKSFQHDNDPFEYVQVSTVIHPSVLYHTSDLDDCRVRHLIEDMVEMALRQPVFNVKKQ